MSTAVLVVESEPSVRRLVRFGLARLGLAVREAETGPQAVALLAADPLGIGAVVAGELLPGLDGLALVAAMAQVAPGLGFFFFCGGSLDPDVFQYPGVEVFLKPNGLIEMCDAIAAFIAGVPA